jgi:photosystem II stability/assembly factor-like uncharacterized protein
MREFPAVGARTQFLLSFVLAAFFAPVYGTEAGWSTLPTDNYPKKRDDIVFLNATTGFYGTGAGRLFRSQDGGRSWQLAWEHAGTFIRSLGFVDEKVGFLGNLGVGLGKVTDATPLYRSDDGGSSWQPVDLRGVALAGVCAIDIVKARAIFEGKLEDRVVIHAAGRANGPAQLIRSENGGRDWRMIDLSDRAGMILDVKFLDPDKGLVFAGTSSDVAKSNALILATTDGGRSWKEVYRSGRPQEIIWKAAFPSALVGFATIQNNDPDNSQQHLLKTTDGGAHWTELPLVRQGGLEEFGIGFVDARHGWIGTSLGGFETRDGGSTWQPSDLARSANKIRTRAVDGTPLVYAIGSAVQMYGAR